MAGRKLTQALENHARLQASPLSEELPPGYKMTELGPLPEEWQVVRLGEVTKLTKGQKPPELLKTYISGSLPYLTADYFRTRITKEWVPKEHLPHLPLCSPEDVVLIWDGSKAGQVFTGLEGVLASTMVRVDPEKELRRDYLFFFLTTQFDTLNTQTTGSTIPHVNKDLFRNLLAPLPPLPEQRAIADVLRTVQRAKEATERVIAALRELKKSLMRYLFTYGPVPVDQADQMALRETEIGPVPEEWEVVRLGDLVNQGILWMKNGFPQGKHNQSGKGIIHLRPFNINEDGDIDISQKKFVDPPQKSQYWVLPGDVIFNNTNSEELVGKTAYFDLHGNFVISNHMTIIRVVRTGIIETYYLARYLHQLWRQGLFRKMCRRHVNQASVSLERLKRLSVPLPPLSEQRAIAEILRAVDRKIEAEEARQRALEALFRTLLHDLMTARRRLPAEFISRFAEETDHE